MISSNNKQTSSRITYLFPFYLISGLFIQPLEYLLRKNRLSIRQCRYFDAAYRKQIQNQSLLNNFLSHFKIIFGHNEVSCQPISLQFFYSNLTLLLFILWSSIGFYFVFKLTQSCRTYRYYI